MSRLSSETQGRMSHAPDDQGRGRYAPAERPRSEEGSSAWMVAGLVGLGVGVLAWYYLWPDLKRYIKIRNM